MAVYATNSRYDDILIHREKQRQAAELREARSEARRIAAEQAQARSDTLRSSMESATSSIASGQSQLMAQIIRSRMADDAKAKAEPAKWYG